MSFPKPHSLPTALGPINTTYTRGLTLDGEEIDGVFHSRERLIEIEAALHDVATKVTLYHEWVHCVFHDNGIHIERSLEETICDVLATALSAYNPNL